MKHCAINFLPLPDKKVKTRTIICVLFFAACSTSLAVLARHISGAWGLGVGGGDCISEK